MKKIIEEFLLERKNAKIKEKVKADLLEDEKQKILDELEDQFSLPVWLLDAAKRASQLTMASHPSKFSHPDAKTSSIIAQSNKVNDGYLRSGNVDFELDVFGNAAALDVYKFLTLKAEDGKTILDHLENDSSQAKEALAIPNINYEELRQSFLSIKQSDKSIKTDRLVKQVYFPLEKDSYHLLSILTPSGLITKVKNQIDGIRFSENSKEARECRKKNEYYEGGFDDFFDLTVLGYGGTKPQNISILNSQNGGRSYLLPSLPPEIKKREVHLPTRDFFENSLWAKSFRTNFEFLDRLIRDKRNNANIRDQISKTLTYIADQVLETVFKIRDFEVGWSSKENYQSLPLAQRIWLDDINLEQREQEENWLEEILADFTRWVIRTYEYLFKETCEKMGPAEFERIKKIIKETINLYPSKDCLIEHKKNKE
jgi:CRISPR-associated protein Csy1